MSETLEDRALFALRIYGPCSIAELCKRLGLPSQPVCSAVSRIRIKNLANRIGEAQYDLTRRGRRVFDDALVQEPSLFSDTRR